jgi:predicted aspartyl protease
MMPLRYRYQPFHTQQPLWQLGGKSVRVRPILTVTVISPTGTGVTDGLLDTGADDTVFSVNLAAKLGIDLSTAPHGVASGVGLVAATVRFAEVKLRITDGREQREWTARVGFTTAPLKRPLLGIAGFLEFFNATFFGDREEVELTVNSLYRGT